MTLKATTKFNPGDKVKLTATYLRNTGQLKGAEGQSRWIVRNCACGLCRLGNHVCVNEPSIYAQADEPDSMWRHFHRENLIRSTRAV